MLTLEPNTFPLASLDRDIFLILLFCVSLTNKSLLESNANPYGFLNLALLPFPSLYPQFPFPAIVVTTPSGVAILILLWWISVKKILSYGSITRFQASLNLASVPVPSSWPQSPLPTKSSTTAEAPEKTIFLILWFSRTNKFPLESKAKSLGLLKVASSTGPLFLPCSCFLLAQTLAIPWELIFSILLSHSTLMYAFPEESKTIPVGPLIPIFNLSSSE